MLTIVRGPACGGALRAGGEAVEHLLEQISFGNANRLFSRLSEVLRPVFEGGNDERARALVAELPQTWPYRTLLCRTIEHPAGRPIVLSDPALLVPGRPAPKGRTDSFVLLFNSEGLQVLPVEQQRGRWVATGPRLSPHTAVEIGRRLSEPKLLRDLGAWLEP